MNPLESTHPVLRRHYSTIGIGDVFVQPEITWQLPSVYFVVASLAHPPPPPVDATTLRLPVTTGTSIDQIPAANEQVILDVQILDEMVGTIKATPEDFVVREMAVVQGVVHIADLTLGDTLAAAANTGAHCTVEVAAIATATVEPLASVSSVAHLATASNNGVVTPIMARSPTASTSAVSGSCSIIDRDDEDPMDRLVRAFEMYQIVVEDPTSPVKHAATPTTPAGACSSQRALAALTALECEALNMLAMASTQSLDGPSVESRSSQVYMTISTSVTMNASDQKQRKREIHDALRNAFPLLDAVSTPALTTTNVNGWCTRLCISWDTCFFPLAPYLFAPAIDLPPLFAFAKRGCEHSQRQAKCERANAKASLDGVTRRNPSDRHRPRKQGPILRLRPDLPREARRPIHQTIDSISKSLLSTETLNNIPFPETEAAATTESMTTTAILVHWSNIAARKVSKKRSREENRVIGHIATSNFLLCVLRKRKKEHLALINTLALAFRCRSADIGLAGIKDFQSVAFQFCTLENFEHQRVLKSKEYLSNRGIDMVPMHKVDQALAKGDLLGNRFEITIRNMRRVQLFRRNTSPPSESFVPVDNGHLKRMVNRVQKSGFVNFYGEQRVGEPGHTTVTGVRAFDIGRAMLQQDYLKAIDLLIRGRRFSNGVEMGDGDIDTFRLTWQETGDPVATAKLLPPGLTTVPRERAVIKGLVRYGKDNPLAALRCLQRNERLFFINGYQSYVWNVMATERIRRYGDKVVVGDLLLLKSVKMPVLATEDMLNESIENVVLPMVGYDVLYPSNKIGELYHQFLANENVKLDKSAPDESTAKGSYRRLVVVATNLSYEVSPSHGKSETTDVKLLFDLPKGSYATMLLRELMLKTVFRASDSNGLDVV